MAESKQPLEEVVDDMSWSEVAELARGYLRIPIALLLVEVFYWFITQPTNTLGLIQEFEAWIWFELTNLIYGPGTAILSDYNGWTTMVTLKHPDFWGDSVYLYVSDECAGVHEMIFISVLIMMSTGVPQRLRIKSAAIACGIVFILNIVRLLILYPMAVSGCAENPNLLNCEQPMHDFHAFVYQWGFLLVLVVMWLIWFKWVNAGDLIRKENEAGRGKWHFIYRKNWDVMQKSILVVSLLLIVASVGSVMLDEQAMIAKENVDFCDFTDSVTGACGEAKDAWAQEIQAAWSMATLGLIGIATTVVKIDVPKRNEEE
ncbi:MAG: exosortase/archaeosortase family protein [Euryarchaeota archaeon]